MLGFHTISDRAPSDLAPFKVINDASIAKVAIRQNNVGLVPVAAVVIAKTALAGRTIKLTAADNQARAKVAIRQNVVNIRATLDLSKSQVAIAPRSVGLLPVATVVQAALAEAARTGTVRVTESVFVGDVAVAGRWLRTPTLFYFDRAKIAVRVNLIGGHQRRMTPAEPRRRIYQMLEARTFYALPAPRVLTLEREAHKVEVLEQSRTIRDQGDE